MSRGAARSVVALALVVAAALLALWMVISRPLPAPDNVAANALRHRIEADWPVDANSAAAYRNSEFEVTVVGVDGRVLMATGKPVADDLTAVRDRASALPVQHGGTRVATVYLADPASRAWARQSRLVGWMASAVLFVGALAVVVAIVAHDQRVVRPFHRLRRYAADVAAGDLDAPLAMDRHNAFGAFTEAFDLLRVELQRAREAEEEARESKRAMVADLSHDIATPVATMGAAAELLELGESDPARRERLATIRAKAAQVGGLVDDLVQANADDLARLPVDLDEVSTRELEAALADAGAGPAHLPDALVLVDLRRWRQVIDNVLANAGKYAGTPVEVAGALRGEVLEVTMRDRGPGVPDAELDAVLGRGVRGSTAGDTPGRGLGLHIADRLMARMGGAVELRPASPGLAVVLTLPLAGGQLRDR